VANPTDLLKLMRRRLGMDIDRDTARRRVVLVCVRRRLDRRVWVRFVLEVIVDDLSWLIFSPRPSLASLMIELVDI